MAPILLADVPAQGPTTGGNTVTLIGFGLSGATSVLFGTTPATTFTVQFDGAILATVPAGTGSVPVTVTTSSGVSNSLTYTYQAPSAPVIFALVPPIGLALGGIPVLIAGNHLSAATSVLFGSKPATSFTVLGDGAILATSPPGTGTVEVTVVAPAGTSNAAAFTYL
ncbi:IPT/TIG domain-containing protein [Streptomyces sp. RB6PN25]|uniref:IPT/TIG domain-containing protein n=1 Tax=Streptomyces humicola TaxID=2953240 RepID=A0ABT1PPX3_9ACTN|nr:IPT/TIG domain-containing protein [Streptomyces humicola]MCQ4079716.1 IPT/TIG domain-containing protein [Streptomyces humicola]